MEYVANRRQSGASRTHFLDANNMPNKPKQKHTHILLVQRSLEDSL